MDDYYSLLGVDADASVDDIRGAYRDPQGRASTPRATPGKADAAKLNKAWNVLSDPYQRGRYDEQRATADGRTATLDVDDGDAADGRDHGAASERLGSKGLRASAPQLAPGARSRPRARPAPSG